MPKIIFTSRYIKNPASSNAGKLIKYMGTREGVEKLPNGIDNAPATKKQNDLICIALKTVPESWDYHEMRSYHENKTKSNATEFLDEFLERNADRIDGVKKLVNYYAERPGVEKIGKHGLFSQTDDKINLDNVADGVSSHNGIVWTHVISLKREDAERLGYNNANSWKNLVRRNALEIAKAHKIEPSDLLWYGAFHNTTHHPHIHLLVYSKSGQGYLTNKGIESMRSAFGNDIFRNEQYKLFEMQTEIRDELKNEAKNVIDDLLNNIDTDVYVSDKMVELFRKLAEQLKSYKGRLMYGYLPKSIKETVNNIVAELARDKNLAKLYFKWNEINREKLSLYYDNEKPDIPLEDNKEFRSIKNYILKSVNLLSIATPINEIDKSSVEQSVSSIVLTLAKLIANSCKRKRAKLFGQVDSKLKSKLEEKKLAHGLKTDRTVNQNDIENDEEQGFTMSM
ncbi:MAG: MobP3 family relaxase [Ruminococcus bromii]|nr:MobP3 family relaxase [Ruminococcus bromii]